MHFKEKVLICSVQECLLWQNSSLEGLKSNSADPVKQRKNTPPPAVGFLLPSSQGWLFHCSKRGRNESNCRLLCLCVSTLGWSSCEAPCIADGVGKTGVPGWELLCRDQEELSAGLGREGLLALTAAGHRREAGMVLLALLTSPGQKTLWVCRLQPWAHSLRTRQSCLRLPPQWLQKRGAAAHARVLHGRAGTCLPSPAQTAHGPAVASQASAQADAGLIQR